MLAEQEEEKEEKEEKSRLATELALLKSMYPEQASFNPRAQELSYRIPSGTLKLRLTESYPQNALPEVISANAGKRDIRDQLQHEIAQFPPGEEILDSAILSFEDLVQKTHWEETILLQQNSAPDTGGAPPDSHAKKTIIVWLHHLLNTNKRKMALSPAVSVSGVTKPGYPGVLIYTGPAAAVQEHVNELKQQNWQAFQVRLETDEEWTFVHGTGVMEVEAMKDVVAEVGQGRKEALMEAMRMK